jgi:hypothetical protein
LADRAADTTPALIEALADADIEVRACSAEAIGRIRAMRRSLACAGGGKTFGRADPEEAAAALSEFGALA